MSTANVLQLLRKKLLNFEYGHNNTGTALCSRSETNTVTQLQP